jgi:hypothetical protein
MDNLNDNVRSTAKITVIHGMKESASVIEVRDATSQCEIGLPGSTD